MASSGSTSGRWRGGIWPNTPPPLPTLGHRGPIGLWEGGAFVGYEQAEFEGWLDDPRWRRPPCWPGDGMWSADARRYQRWEREYRSERGETYLRLSELDLDDVDAVLDFVSTFNILDVRALDAPRVERQWYGVAPPRVTPLRILHHYPGFGEIGPGAAVDSSLRAMVIAACEAERKAAPTWVIEETLEEFRWAARAISDLHTAWRCLRDGRDPREAAWANRLMPSAGVSLSRAVWISATFLEQTVSDALEGFSPRLRLIDGNERPLFQLPRDLRSTTPEPADVTMFEVLVLELFRHIAEDASFKTCANPACQHPFVRQEGGAAHGQSHMTGVMYCSRRCAKAVAQRRYRRRAAAT